jgi:hypothetical protein
MKPNSAWYAIPLSIFMSSNLSLKLYFKLALVFGAIGKNRSFYKFTYIGLIQIR